MSQDTQDEIHHLCIGNRCASRCPTWPPAVAPDRGTWLWPQSCIIPADSVVLLSTLWHLQWQQTHVFWQLNPAPGERSSSRLQHLNVRVCAQVGSPQTLVLNWAVWSEGPRQKPISSLGASVVLNGSDQPHLGLLTLHMGLGVPF